MFRIFPHGRIAKCIGAIALRWKGQVSRKCSLQVFYTWRLVSAWKVQRGWWWYTIPVYTVHTWVYNLQGWCTDPVPSIMPTAVPRFTNSAGGTTIRALPHSRTIKHLTSRSEETLTRDWRWIILHSSCWTIKCFRCTLDVVAFIINHFWIVSTGDKMYI